MNRREIHRLMALLMVALTVMAQEPVPTVTLTSNSQTLQLPGTLNLTATVAPPAGSGAVPTGSVQLFADGSTSLGTANLTVLPGTEGFSDPAIAGLLTNFPTDVFAVNVKNPNRAVLGAVNTYYDLSENASPQFTIYSGSGSALFQNGTNYLLNSANCNCPAVGGYADAYAIGDFNKDGIPDVMIHATNATSTSSSEYFMVTGNGDGTFNLAGTTVSSDDSGYTAFSSNPNIVTTADDFNGDGYADIAYAGDEGLVGVALNPGSSSSSTPPGSFSTYTTLPTPPGSLIYPSAIATGHLTSSGHADIIVGSGSLQEMVVYLGNGDGTFAAPATVAVGSYPSSVATGDLRKSGFSDVVVASYSYQGAAVGVARPARQATPKPRPAQTGYLGTIQVFFSDGKGNLALSSTITPTVAPNKVALADVNGDGYPDIIATGVDGTLFVYLNDGTGNFNPATTPSTGVTMNFPCFAVGDFNGDALPDILELNLDVQGNNGYEFLNSASSQIALTTPPKSLPAGTHALTASYAGDTNFSTATSTALSISVTQSPTTITWTAPTAPLEYGIPLSAAQLDAVASQPGSISYSSPAGTVLPPGQTVVTATFAPTDSFDYMGATATQTITVTPPSLSGVSPSSANLGASNTTIAINGQGFINGAVVNWNSTPLSTAWVSLNQLTAVVPASLLSSSGTATITVADPNRVSVAGSAQFSIVASPAVAQATVPATVEAGQNSSVSLTLSPYPVDVTATLTLSFTPTPPNTLNDPTVLFSNNSTTDTFTIPANSSGSIPPINFSSGSTAGTIALTIQLTAAGSDITPSGLGPYSIAVPESPPGITSAVLTRNGTSMSLAIMGFSPTREMTEAKFHFTPAAGKTLKTTDLTVSLSSAFVQYYQSPQSDAAGTAYLYTQPFTLNTDASSVASVSVIVSNSKGDSQPVTAQ